MIDILEIKKKPKVSVIIPTYNSERFIEKCIESVLNQTLKEIEVIVIDDNSVDSTKSIIENYAKNDRRIKCFFSKKNRGAGYSRNIGIKISSGEFIGFIDSDDFVDQKWYEYLYNNSKDKDIVHGVRVIHNFQKSFNKSKSRLYGCIIPSIIRKSFIIKKKIEFPIVIDRGEDSTFKKYIYKAKPRIAKLSDNGIYYHYVKREGSLSRYNKIE